MRLLLYARRYHWLRDKTGAHLFSLLDEKHAAHTITTLAIASWSQTFTSWALAWAQARGISTLTYDIRPNEEARGFNRRVLANSQPDRVLVFPASRGNEDFLRRAHAPHLGLIVHYAPPIPTPQKPPRRPAKIRLTPRRTPRPLHIRRDRLRYGNPPTAQPPAASPLVP